MTICRGKRNGKFEVGRVTLDLAVFALWYYYCLFVSLLSSWFILLVLVLWISWLCMYIGLLHTFSNPQNLVGGDTSPSKKGVMWTWSPYPVSTACDQVLKIEMLLHAEALFGRLKWGVDFFLYESILTNEMLKKYLYLSISCILLPGWIYKYSNYKMKCHFEQHPVLKRWCREIVA